MANYWVVRLGEGGKYAENGRKGNYIAIGWNELGDLTFLADPNGDPSAQQTRLLKLWVDTYPNDTPNQRGIGIGQVMKFMKSIAPGDIVLVPKSDEAKVLACAVIGDYMYVQSPNDGCPYPNRKEVQWLRDLYRRDMSAKLRNTLGSLSTVFSPNTHRAEIEALLFGKEAPPGKPIPIPSPDLVTGKELTKALIDRLMYLDARQFEVFCTDMLRTVGFEASTTQYVGDKGVDIIGTLNAEGLATITLRVQVKRVKNSIGNDEVLKIRGTLGQDEHGAIITTSRFTTSAREEAQSPHKKPIALIDGIALAELILTHFEDLEENTKQFLNLRRKTIPMEEQFFIITA